jgi:hypothetical protein
VFRSFVRSAIGLFTFGPGFLGTIRGFIEASEKVGFDKNHPSNHAKLVSLLNDLLYIATEHWPLYIIVVLLLAFFWAVIVAEPKAASKRKFRDRKRARIGTRR